MVTVYTAWEQNNRNVWYFYIIYNEHNLKLGTNKIFLQANKIDICRENKLRRATKWSDCGLYLLFTFYCIWLQRCILQKITKLLKKSQIAIARPKTNVHFINLRWSHYFYVLRRDIDKKNCLIRLVLTTHKTKYTQDCLVYILNYLMFLSTNHRLFIDQ